MEIEFNPRALRDEDIPPQFSGSWDGTELKLDIPDLRVNAPYVYAHELERTLAGELEKAVERSKISGALSRLPWIPGGRSVGGDMPEVTTHATSSQEVAEAIVETVWRQLYRLLGEKCVMPIEQLRANDPEGDDYSWYTPMTPPPPWRDPNEPVQFAILPPEFVDRFGKRHIGEEEALRALNAELEEIRAEEAAWEMACAAREAREKKTETTRESTEKNGEGDLALKALMEDPEPLTDETGAFDGGTLVAGPVGESRNELHDMIRKAHGEEVLRLYLERQELFQKLAKDMPKEERDTFRDQLGKVENKLKSLTDYDNVFSQGFRDEQKQLAKQWVARLTTPTNCRKYTKLMDAINNAPSEERKKLVEMFYTQVAEDAGMPQRTIQVVSLANYVPEGSAARAVARGYDILLEQKAYAATNIDWPLNMAKFFHEQAHEWMYKFIAQEGLSAYPEDVAKMRHANQNYIRAAISMYMYYKNYTEQHGDKFEQPGLDVYSAWNSYRRGKKK